MAILTRLWGIPICGTISWRKEGRAAWGCIEQDHALNIKHGRPHKNMEI